MRSVEEIAVTMMDEVVRVNAGEGESGEGRLSGAEPVANKRTIR